MIKVKSSVAYGCLAACLLCVLVKADFGKTIIQLHHMANTGHHKFIASQGSN